MREIAGSGPRSAATTTQVLPVQPPEAGAKQRDYILSPNAESILGELLPLYVRNAIYRAFLRSALSTTPTEEVRP